MSDFNGLLEALGKVAEEFVRIGLDRIEPDRGLGGRPVGPALLRPKEAAEFLGMSLTTLGERRRTGRLKPVDEDGRTMYRRVDLVSYTRKLKPME